MPHVAAGSTGREAETRREAAEFRLVEGAAAPPREEVVADFDAARDALDLGFLGLSAFAEVAPLIEDDGGDVVIRAPGGPALRICGARRDRLGAAHFVFSRPCFAEGALIQTVAGPVPVETLKPGDPVVTLDRGPQPVRWVARAAPRLADGPDGAKPVEIKAGALGPGLPRRPLRVAPGCAVLLRAPELTGLFGVDEALAPAAALLRLPQIRAMKGRRAARYFSPVTDRHEVLIAEGAPAAGLYPAPARRRVAGPAGRRRLDALFPALAADPEAGYGPPARRVLTPAEARRLVEAMLAGGWAEAEAIEARRAAAGGAAAGRARLAG